MPAPKHDPRTRLATGALLLVPLYALWILVSPHLSSPVGLRNPRGGSGDKPAFPAACLTAGAPTQGEWTLRAVTALTPGTTEVSLPPVLERVPAGVPDAVRMVSLTGSGGGTGLWIGMEGGLGFQTRTIPEDGRRHVYPFGPVSLVAQPGTPGTALTLRWKASGKPGDISGPFPYQLISAGTTLASGGHPAAQTVMLTPFDLSQQFRVTAQALSAEGKVLGRAVPLRCRPVATHTLFAQIPLGYSDRTRQFWVAVTRTGSTTGGAAWRLGALPPSTRNGPDDLPFVRAARFGPFVVRALAAEAPDIRTDSTGIPAIHYRLSARQVSSLPPGQFWEFRFDQATPQWSDQPRPPVTALIAFFPLHAAPPPAQEWTMLDGQIGLAYPGQQKWIQPDGEVIRARTHTETVTFQDADVGHDAAFGGDRLVWHHSETQTTPSGIIVAVLNGRSGTPETAARGSRHGGNAPGTAGLLLAWHLPPGVQVGEPTSDNPSRMVYPPRGTGPIRLLPDTSQPGPIAEALPPSAEAVALSGSRKARTLTQADYSLLRLVVSEPGKTLPRHLKTLTLQMMLREEQEQRPMHLVVPIRPVPPSTLFPVLDSRRGR